MHTGKFFAAVGLALAAFAAPASAEVSFSIEFGAPPQVYYAPPPRVVAPPRVVEYRPAPPYGHVWIPAQWAWHHNRYVWVDGYWSAAHPAHRPVQVVVERRWHGHPGHERHWQHPGAHPYRPAAPLHRDRSHRDDDRDRPHRDDRRR